VVGADGLGRAHAAGRADIGSRVGSPEIVAIAGWKLAACSRRSYFELGDLAVRDHRFGARRIRRAVPQRSRMAARLGWIRIAVAESCRGARGAAAFGAECQLERLAVEAEHGFVGGADGSCAGRVKTRFGADGKR